MRNLPALGRRKLLTSTEGPTGQREQTGKARGTANDLLLQGRHGPTTFTPDMKETAMTRDPDWTYWIGGIVALPVAALLISLIGACLDGWLLGL